MVWLRVVVIGVFAFIIFPLSFNCSNYYPGFDRSLFFNFLDLLCIATIPGAFWCNASYWKCELSCLIHSTCLTCMLILIGHAVQFLIYEQCLSLCSARITPPPVSAWWRMQVFVVFPVCNFYAYTCHMVFSCPFI